MLPQRIDYYSEPPWLNYYRWLQVAATIHSIADKMRQNQYSSIKLKEMENTIKIKFADDGSEFFVPNAPMAIVRMMRDTSRFTSDEDLKAYMMGFVDRYRTDSGNNVRCDSYENFVADLKKFGFFTEVATGLQVGDKIRFTNDHTRQLYESLFRTNDFIIKKIMPHAKRRNGTGYRIETLKGEYIVNTSSEAIERI